jgi:hypothetical protein
MAPDPKALRPQTLKDIKTPAQLWYIAIVTFTELLETGNLFGISNDDYHRLRLEYLILGGIVGKIGIFGVPYGDGDQSRRALNVECLE